MSRRRVIPQPHWSFSDALTAAWDAYIGSGITSTGYRNNFLVAWAQLVGRERALSGLDAFVEQAGGWQQAAYDAGMAEVTLRRLRQTFTAVQRKSAVATEQWDVFISHASEDKEDVARPLAERLRQTGLRVWLDESELKLGDSLRQRIDHGLANSRYGVVILSKSFFGRSWTERELAGLLTVETHHHKVVLPVWHGVDHEFLAGFSPILADKFAISTEKGLPAVTAAIVEALSVP